MEECSETQTELDMFSDWNWIGSPRAPGYVHPGMTRKTVKELIMMKRQAMQSQQTVFQQKKPCVRQPDREPISPAVIKEVASNESTPALPSMPSPTMPAVTNLFPPGPKNGHVPFPQQLVRCSAALTGALSPLADDLPKRVRYAAPTSSLPPIADCFQIQHVQCSAPNSALSPLADGRMTFFQWQILQEVQKMEGMDPEALIAQDEDGDTFLHIAVAQGKRALAYVLASKMAAAGFLDVKENKGQTALQLAAATNQHLIVQDLLLHGAQLNTADCWGRSPLHLCAEKGHVLTLQIIHRVLNGSWQLADVERVNYDGLTPLHAAVLCHNAVTKELRCLPAPPSHRAEELRLRSQMYGGCITTLLLMGACCGTQDLKSGRTSVHMASEEANMDLLHIFLDQPSSLSVVKMKMFNGNTALHIASSLRNRSTQVEAVRLLLRRGSDPSIKNNENELPAQLVPTGPAGDKVRQILKGKDVHP